jgi:hypothetical protein
VPHRLIDLTDVGGARSHGAAGEGAMPAQARRVPAVGVVPAPGGSSHVEYGRRLGVARFDPARAPASAAPLWYVVDDVALQHRALALGVATWGALEALVERGGGLAVVADHGRAYARARALAGALAAVCEGACVGVGRPVDRDALIASGALSARMLDRVAAVGDTCGGDARTLVARLEGKAVPNLHRGVLDELRQFLSAGGYLDPRPVHSGEELRAAALAASARALADGSLAPHDLDALWCRLAHGPHAGAPDADAREADPSDVTDGVHARGEHPAPVLT